MNKKNSLIILVTLLILGATFSSVCAQSLDELLDGGKANVPKVSESTQKLWSDLLDSLQKSDFSNAMNQANSFINIKDVVEPYQSTFTKLVLELLQNPTLDPDDAELKAKRRDLDRARRQLAGLKNELAVIRAKKASLPPKIIRGTVAYQEYLECQRKLADNEGVTKDVEAMISQLEPEIVAATDRKKRQIRTLTITNIQNSQTSGDYRAVVALVNTYLIKVGSDSEIAKLGQDYINSEVFRKKAIQIAKAALQPAVDRLEKGRYWEVKPEITKAVDKINSRVKNKVELDLIKSEMDAPSKDLDRKIEAIMKEREMIFEWAEQNALDGMTRLEAFHAKYQDYPDYEKDKLLIDKMKSEQISIIDKRNRAIAEKELSKKIAAIKAVIRNDPAEAKKMIRVLAESCTDPDEISVLNSEITKLKREILEREVELIRADMDEAQSYLMKISKSSSIIPGFPAEVKVGRENLVRARSLQAGALKRLEILLNEEMDTVTKSKYVGLLETQKVALDQMDRMFHDSEASALRFKIMMTLGVILVMALGCSAFFLLRKKSNPS